MSDWQTAQLFSTAGISSDAEARGRATEALLATVPLVPAYAAALLGSVGVRAGSRSSVQTFIDVPLGTGRAPVGDGLIQVSKGKTRWTSSVLVRTGSDRLTPATLKRARDAAAKAGFDAVITITNDPEGPQLAPSRSKVGVFHWPWGSLLGAAIDEKVRDVEQGQILGSLIAFLSHPDAKIVSFGDMGPNWAGVLKTARTSRLSARDNGVVDVCRRWDQVLRHAAATLGRAADRDVQLVLPAAQARSADKRLDVLVDGLVDSGQLTGVFDVADSAGELAVVADLEGRRIVTVVVVAPPSGLGARATAGWLLDGLEQASGDAVVESWARGGRRPLSTATVRELSRDMSLLESSRGKLGDSYRVLLADEMGTARTSGGKSAGFVESVGALLLRTWGEVLAPLSGVAVSARRSSPTWNKRSSTKSRTTSTKTRTSTKTKRSTTSSRSSPTSTRSSSGARRGSPTSLPSSRSSSSRTSRSSTKKRSSADLARELRNEK